MSINFHCCEIDYLADVIGMVETNQATASVGELASGSDDLLSFMISESFSCIGV